MVILDKDDYITEAHNQIFNGRYYKPLDGPVCLNTIDEVNSILDNGWLDNKQGTYLRPVTIPDHAYSILCQKSLSQCINDSSQMKFLQAG